MLATVSALFAVRPAAANGRFPASSQIVFSPTDPRVIVARTTYAILPSTDNGATWSYLCEDGLGLPSTTFQDPELGITAGGSLIVGLDSPTKGIDFSRDLGCNWSCVGGGLADQRIVDIAVRPGSQANQVLALSYSPPGSAVDAGTRSQVFQSTDDGVTWSALGMPIDPSVTVETIDVAASDPMRIYVSGTRGVSVGRTASLFTSLDAGATWVEHVVSQFIGSTADSPGGEEGIFIGAVDPKDANLVYLRSRGSIAGGDSRVYVTRDAGRTFQVAPAGQGPAAGDFQVPGVTASTLVGELMGFAISPDGSKVYAGTKESGLWVASSSDLVFKQANAKIGIQCLATRQTAQGSELWACANEFGGPPGNPGNFIVGMSTDDGVTFSPKLRTLTSLRGKVDCKTNSPATFACGTDASTATACGCADYKVFCSTAEAPNACLGCGQGGESDAAPGGKPSSPACRCSMVGGPGTMGVFAGLAVAALGLGRRKRR
jgi:hypothetical protein